MDNNERSTSQDDISQVASRTTSRVTARDYAEEPLSRSTSQVPPRTRYADFNFGPGSLRHRVSNLDRMSNLATSPSPGPTHGWRHFDQMSTRRSVAIAPPSIRDNTDTESRKFSLAGPATIDTVAANQTYVDPGYAQLNPAYDQPVNVRPVWGLAKPLPRVLRPGMVPTKDELETEAPEEGETQPPVDIEAGRIEPSLRPDKVASTLDTVRREREIALIRAYENQYNESPGFSPFGGAAARRTSDAPTVTPSARVRLEEPIEEESSDRSQPQVEPPELSLPEAVAGLKAAKEEDGESRVPYEDAVPLSAYDAEDDEVHNLHTYWSIIRLRLREPLAELLGITVQYTLGFSANLSMTVSRGTAGVGDTGMWAWGLATMLAIYVAGGISGAHLNPAISLMLYIYRGFPLSKVPIYVAAQMLGAVLATLISFGIFQPGLIALIHDERVSLQRQSAPPIDMPTGTAHTTSDLSLPPSYILTVLSNFLTFPRSPWVSVPVAFFTEFTATCLLTISVLALGDDTNAPPGAGMNAFIVGLLITMLGMSFGSITGLAMNPVRDFGPRVTMLLLGYGTPSTLFGDGYWFKVNWLGPLMGAIFGGFLYDAAIFVGGESPVNYPSRRMRRAARKWRKRWKVRMGWNGRVKTGKAQK
ncbi:hypothetical protein G647_03691 [Cladophialophora carrionii CBS 160.54]|uniref:Aquaporin n=1 Tax=Cladophialophora carrionii CBS 160.54 TaxID=1279043 RepID=V9DEF0_9EURO|nr:uncharacterized protein G647_03691 [Cladophialophora carrionii CBS 160.54]ETI24322.1 hypothetical protein G647_03691 [Cladophialophora carrionii CBS 160.54]